MSYITSMSRAETFTPIQLLNSCFCTPGKNPRKKADKMNSGRAVTEINSACPVTKINSGGAVTDQSFRNRIPYCHRKLPSENKKAVSQTGILRVSNGRNLTQLVQYITANRKSENADYLLTTSINQYRWTTAANAPRLRTQCQYLQSRKISKTGKDVNCYAKTYHKKGRKQNAVTFSMDGYRKVRNRIQMENSWAGGRKEKQSPNRSIGGKCLTLDEGNTCNNFTVMRDPLSMHQVLTNSSSQATNACRCSCAMKREINRNINAFFTTSKYDSQDKRKELADGQLKEDNSLEKDIIESESPTNPSLKFCSLDDEQVQKAVSKEFPGSDVRKTDENALMQVIADQEGDIKLMIFSSTGLDQRELDESQIEKYQDVKETGHNLGFVKIRLDDELSEDTTVTPEEEISSEVIVEIDPTGNLTGSDNIWVSSDVTLINDVKQPDRYEVDGIKSRSEDEDIRVEILTLKELADRTQLKEDNSLEKDVIESESPTNLSLKFCSLEGVYDDEQVQQAVSKECPGSGMRKTDENALMQVIAEQEGVTPEEEISFEVIIKIDATGNLTGSENMSVSSDVTLINEVKQPDRYEVDGTKSRSEDEDIRVEILPLKEEISSKRGSTKTMQKRRSERLSDGSLSSSWILRRKRRLNRPGPFVSYIRSQDYFAMPPCHCLPKYPRLKLPIPYGVLPELRGANYQSPTLKPAAPFKIFPPEKAMAFSYQTATKHYSSEIR